MRQLAIRTQGALSLKRGPRETRLSPSGLMTMSFHELLISTFLFLTKGCYFVEHSRTLLFCCLVFPCFWYCQFVVFLSESCLFVLKGGNRKASDQYFRKRCLFFFRRSSPQRSLFLSSHICSFTFQNPYIGAFINDLFLASEMVILVFDGKVDAYWWVLCTDQYFKRWGTLEAEKMAVVAIAMKGCALTWWLR